MSLALFLALLLQAVPMPATPQAPPPGIPAFPPVPELVEIDEPAPADLPADAVPVPVPPTPVDALGLRGDVERFIGQSGLGEAVWTVIVRDVARDSVLLRMNPVVVKPASNLKLLSSAAFLHRFGPDFTFTTGVWLRGGRHGDTWRGDLVVVGSGDPTIGAPWLDTPPLGFFEELADSLSARGIRRIEGDLVGVESLFDAQPYPAGWSWDDITFYYAVQNAPLSFHENTVDLTVHADAPPGGRPRIEWFPYSTDYMRFRNEQVVLPPDSSYDEGYLRDPGTNLVHLTSALPQGMVEEEAIAVHDPGAYFMDTLHKTLLRDSIAVSGRVRTTRDTLYLPDTLGLFLPEPWKTATATTGAPDAAAPELLASYESPALSVLLGEMNQESSNFISEMLAKTLAVLEAGRPGSTGEGVEAIRGQLADLGVDTAKVYLQDASGMSPGNRFSADELNRLLVLMTRHPHAGVYRQSLAVAGRSGTLERRLTRPGRFCPGDRAPAGPSIPPDAPPAYATPCIDRPGAFAGKSGYISGVRTLSGYLTTAGGRELAVTLATNQFIGKVSQVDRVQEAILTLLHEKIP